MMNETRLKCVHCKRFLGEVAQIIGTLPCPACKGETQFKIVSTDISKSLTYEFKDTPKAPKKKETTE